MKNNNAKLVIFLSLLLSSCGLIEKFKTSDNATDSTPATTESTTAESSATPSDDLFTDMANANTTDSAPANSVASDAPNNITTESMLEPAQNQDELASLQNEFTGSGPQESSVKEIEPAVKPVITEAPMPEKVVTKKPVPMKVREEAPVIDTEMAEAKVTNAGTGNIKTYSVKKGETLMQIAFKIYGDISKWKELKKLNGDKLASNASLRSKLTLKYIEPETEFVWNPEGTPYMIQNGDTLGIISNNVYQTPKKWKSIWENNKPLIKNPNVIYAGFTLYYKNNGMANYVQPKTLQPKITNNKTEEIKVEQALTELERLNSSSEEITDIRSAVVRAPASEDAEESIPDTGSTTQTSTEDTQDDTPIDVAE